MPYSPAKPLLRSATLCVGRDCAHFRHILFFFFFIFSLFFYFFSFFRPRGGGRVGHVEGQDPQGYVVLRVLFCYLERLPAIRIKIMAIVDEEAYSFTHIAHSRHIPGRPPLAPAHILPG